MDDQIISVSEENKPEESGIKLYPGWKNAQDKILQSFESGGFTYGTIFTKEQLSEWFYLPVISGLHTFEEYTARNSLFYNSVASLIESLGENHCLWLSNERDVGWELLHPDDQIKIEVQKKKQSAFRDIEKATSLLINVRHEQLSPEAQRIRDREIAFCAFMTRGLPNKKGYKEIEGSTE
jgi:hypothetical protein